MQSDSHFVSLTFHKFEDVRFTTISPLQYCMQPFAISSFGGVTPCKRDIYKVFQALTHTHSANERMKKNKTQQHLKFNYISGVNYTNLQCS